MRQSVHGERDVNLLEIARLIASSPFLAWTTAKPLRESM